MTIDPILLAVDMGEGGPMEDFDRVMREADDAMRIALCGPVEMFLTEPSPYAASRIHEQIRLDLLRGRR